MINAIVRQPKQIHRKFTADIKMNHSSQQPYITGRERIGGGGHNIELVSSPRPSGRWQKKDKTSARVQRQTFIGGGNTDLKMGGQHLYRYCG